MLDAIKPLIDSGLINEDVAGELESTWESAEIKAAFERGDVLEIFGTGTAAVIQPINGIVYEGKEYKPVVPFDDSMLQVRLTNFLIGVQYGDIDHPWSHVVPPSTWSKPM